MIDVLHNFLVPLKDTPPFETVLKEFNWKHVNFDLGMDLCHALATRIEKTNRNIITLDQTKNSVRLQLNHHAVIVAHSFVLSAE